MGLKTSPEKGMLESTQIKGGQVDFTTGKEPGPVSMIKSPEGDKKANGSDDDNDVYVLINQMIKLLKQADGKNA